MSIAGGRLIILDGRGQIIVAEADPEAYVELSRQPVLEGGPAWSTPVLSHGRIYCRSCLGQLECLDYRGSQEEPVARPTEAVPLDLPEADAVVARHVAAIRGHEALERVRSVQMRGTSFSLINTVRTGEIDLAWDAERGFSWSDVSGLEYGHDASTGWIIQPRSAPSVLIGESLDALREAGDFARLFDPGGFYTSMETVEARVFEGRECYALRGRTPEGHERTLYFDVESGLCAGHQGEGIPLWTLDDYREFDGVLLPTRWSTYDPENGESASATFQEASINPEPRADRFAVPDVVRPFLRTPEEIARDNDRLTRLHAAILGEWRSEQEPERRSTFEVRDGFLALLQAERPPSYLGEADAQGSLALLGAEYVSFTPERTGDGPVEAIVLRVGGEERDRLLRAD
jgi:hypothetical protein